MALGSGVRGRAVFTVSANEIAEIAAQRVFAQRTPTPWLRRVGVAMKR